MHYFLIILGFLGFAVMAPAPMTIAALGAFAMLVYVGARTVTLVTGASADTGEVLRSVGLAFVFAGATLFGMYLQFGTIELKLVMIAVLAAYVLGFSVGLDVDFGQACLIAGIISIASGGLYYLLNRFLMPIF